jgi:hypothetical protein
LTLLSGKYHTYFLVSSRLSGIGPKVIDFKCDSPNWFVKGIYSHQIQNQEDNGDVIGGIVAQDGKLVNQEASGAPFGIAAVSGECLS